MELSKRKLCVLALVVISLLISYLFMNFDVHVIQLAQPPNKVYWVTTKVGNSSVSERTNKLIVIYTTFFGERPWSFVLEHENYTETCGCDFKACQLTYDTNRVREADAVVFHARNMPDLTELENLHRVRKINQKWIYFIMENPRNAPDVVPLDKYFDWTLTYRLSSDFRMPYARHMRKANETPPDNINYAQGKTKQIAWFVSNCGQLREQLARKLEENGVKVFVGGACAGRFANKMQCADRECKEEFRKFKFYFAAENGLCEDYITEKYWYKSIEVNTIPIVLGGSNYFNPRLAIPGSFIDALSFKSVKDLADRIKEIDKDDAKFNEYFQWKRKWKYYGLGRGCEEFMCNICTRLHEKPLLRSRALSSQINQYRECDSKEALFKTWIKD